MCHLGCELGSWQETKDPLSCLCLHCSEDLMKNFFAEVWAGLKELMRDVEARVESHYEPLSREQ